MAPEVLKGENHSFSVDFYAIGIIVYECIFGHRPYIAKSKHQMKELMMTTQAEITPNNLPEGWSPSVISFVNGLLQRKAYKRLGHNSIKDIMKHEWLEDINWIKIKAKSEKAPYVPKRGDNFDKKYCRSEKLLGMDTIERYKSYLNDEQYKDIFKDFEMNKVRLNEGTILEDIVNSSSSGSLRKKTISEDETKQSSNNNNRSLNILFKHENKLSGNNSIVDNSINNSSTIFPCLKNKKATCCIRKEVMKNSAVIFFNPTNKCLNNLSSKPKILLNKMNNSNFSFNDKSIVNNNNNDNNNNKVSLDLPNIHKSLIINEKEQPTLIKKILKFNKIGRNDERNAIRALSLKYAQIYNNNNKNNNNNNKSNSFLLNQQRSTQRNLLSLKVNKSCSNIYINNKPNEKLILNCKDNNNLINSNNIC